MSFDVTLKTQSLNNYNLSHFVTQTWQFRMQSFIWHSDTVGGTSSRVLWNGGVM